MINYDLPNVPETYVHRIGRTGRASASGVALSFCDVEERPYLKDIQKLISQQLPVIEDHPFEDDASEALPLEEKRPSQNRHKQRTGQSKHRGGRNNNRNRNRSRNNRSPKE